MEFEKIKPADKTEEHLDEEKVSIDRNFLSSKEYVRLEELTNLRKQAQNLYIAAHIEYI